MPGNKSLTLSAMGQRRTTTKLKELKEYCYVIQSQNTEWLQIGQP